MNVSVTSIVFAIAMAVLLFCAAGVQSIRLHFTEQQHSQTQADLDAERARSAGLQRSIAELEKNAAAKAVRETTASEAKEAISAAPEGDESAIAPVLLRGLHAADQIGELE
jgi:hypothetical protein